MGNVFFTSDQHFGHMRINELAGRPFSSVERMNLRLLLEWNCMVAEEDTVYVLGDFIMGKKSETLPIAKLLKGTIKLVPGNHDRVMPDDKQLEKWLLEYEAVGIEVMPQQMVLPEDPRFYLCHFPIHGDSGLEDRYTEWRPTIEAVGDRVLLHGHVHEAFRVRNWPYSIDPTESVSSLNVGVDVNNWRPISLEAIKAEFGLQ